MAGLMRKVLRAIRLGEDRVRQVLHLHASPAARERAAQRFWSRPPVQRDAFWWHLRGSDAYSDEQWLKIGRHHVDLYRRLAGEQARPRRVIEWGAGGGANVVAFASAFEANDFWGVDVSADSIAECGRQLAAFAPATRYHGLKIDVPTPETALNDVPHDLDLFLCIYVFESFPSQGYGERILRLAHQMLKPRGDAFIQVKYSTDAWQTRSRNWGYTRGVANMTTYRIDEFWLLAEACGFQPQSVVLMPKPTDIPDERYAYYLLRKP